MNQLANAIVATGADEQAGESAWLPIAAQPDVLEARQKGREFAMHIGFTGSDVTVVAAAICEIARNIVDYAQCGEMTFSAIDENNRKGMLIIARDQGPGIPDVNQALRYGCSTRKGLGVGLPGAKWLMDEFQIDSQAGNGTTVRMVKWLPGQPK
jgi:serine/threonine-protein kinase RsbT